MNTETKLEFEIIEFSEHQVANIKTGDVLIVPQSNICYVIECEDYNTIGLRNGKEYNVSK